MNPKKIMIDVTTQEIIEIELTDEEYAAMLLEKQQIVEKKESENLI
jgi:hypothetical protein